MIPLASSGPVSGGIQHIWSHFGSRAVIVVHMLDALPFDDIRSAPTTTEEALSLMDSLWAWLLGSGIRIVVILLVATIASALVNWLVRRFVRTMIGSSAALSSVTGAVVRRDQRAAKAAQARRNQRAETLSNVARNVARMVIWAVALVMILAEVGVNIAPVIASLGVIGLAAGIGAQTIIKDFVAGVVMLFEDILAVGDFVDLEYATGTVEEINLRVTQVRDISGVLWTVRNGEIIRVGNFSRGFATALVTLDIDPAADNDKVTTVLTQVGEEFAQSSEMKDLLHGPVEVSGILSVDGARYRRRLTAKVAPGEQWTVEQELRRCVREAFDREQIGFALPRFSETQK